MKNLVEYEAPIQYCPASLADEDRSFLEEVVTLCENEGHRGHSEYQIRNFILNDEEFPLYVSKFYQALLELSGRLQGTYDDFFSLREIEIEINLLLLSIEEEGYSLADESDISIRRRALRIEKLRNKVARKKFQQSQLFKSLQSRLQEMRCFKQAIDDISPLREASTYEDKEKLHWAAIKEWREANRQFGMAQLPKYGMMLPPQLEASCLKRGVAPSFPQTGELRANRLESSSRKSEELTTKPTKQIELESKANRRKFVLIPKQAT